MLKGSVKRVARPDYRSAATRMVRVEKGRKDSVGRAMQSVQKFATDRNKGEVPRTPRALPEIFEY